MNTIDPNAINSRNDEMGHTSNFHRRVLANVGLWVGLLFHVALIIRNFISPIEIKYNILLVFCFMGLLAVPLLIKKKVQTLYCTFLILLCFSFIGIIAGIQNAGIKAPATIIFLFLPILGFFGGGKRAALVGIGLSFSAIFFLFYAEKYNYVNELLHPEKFSSYMTVIYLVGTVMTFLLGAAYERSRRISNDIISKLTVTSIQSAKMASLGEMAAGVAHEINNPLMILSGYLHTINDQSNELESFESRVSKMEKACIRISKIVNGLKKFSRSAESSPHVNVPLSSIVAETLNLSAAFIDKCGINLQQECDNDSLILCNEIEIEQVLLNIIQNAIYAAKSSEAKWIKVKLFEERGSLILQISDSGPGIPKNVKNRIFDPFFTTKPVGDGTGLGLSISKGILEDHGASIQILNNSSVTCFEIRFPRAI